MIVIRKIIETYITVEGRSPYREWFLSLRDGRVQARIRSRLTRVELGNFGDYKSIGAGIFELRLDFGPGYRIYFGQVRNLVVLLLIGGDKHSQVSDIKKAQRYWDDYMRRSIYETK